VETRLIIALVLITILVLALLFVVARYYRRRKQFKIRQMGRGKAVPGQGSNPSN
jgi:heme/copper-type cytochrome/quinol oxidase subunit 2